MYMYYLDGAEPATEVPDAFHRAKRLDAPVAWRFRPAGTLVPVAAPTSSQPDRQTVQARAGPAAMQPESGKRRILREIRFSRILICKEVWF